MIGILWISFNDFIVIANILLFHLIVGFLKNRPKYILPLKNKKTLGEESTVVKVSKRNSSEQNYLPHSPHHAT